MVLCEWKCWSTLSPLKIKLILIMIVAIPYMITLITAITVLALIEPSNEANDTLYLKEVSEDLFGNYLDNQFKQDKNICYKDLKKKSRINSFRIELSNPNKMLDALMEQEVPENGKVESEISKKKNLSGGSRRKRNLIPENKLEGLSRKRNLPGDTRRKSNLVPENELEVLSRKRNLSGNSRRKRNLVPEIEFEGLSRKRNLPENSRRKRDQVSVPENKAEEISRKRNLLGSFRTKRNLVPENKVDEISTKRGRDPENVVDEIFRKRDQVPENEEGFSRNCNLSGSSSRKRDLCVCLFANSTSYCQKSNDTSKYPFISAITESVSVENLKEIRLRCVGTNINEYLVLTSSECFYKNRKNETQFLIKIGNNIWSSYSPFYSIKQVFYPNPDEEEKSPVLIFLNEKLPEDKVKFAEISDENLTNLYDNQYFSTYFWKSSFIHQVKPDNPEKLVENKISLGNCSHCKGKNYFCADVTASGCSSRWISSGYPLFYEDKLIGMQISSYCHIGKSGQITGKKEICFTPISSYSTWIQNMKVVFNGKGNMEIIKVEEKKSTLELFTRSLEPFFKNILNSLAPNNGTEVCSVATVEPKKHETIQSKKTRSITGRTTSTHAETFGKETTKSVIRSSIGRLKTSTQAETFEKESTTGRPKTSTQAETFEKETTKSASKFVDELKKQWLTFIMTEPTPTTASEEKTEQMKNTEDDEATFQSHFDSILERFGKFRMDLKSSTTKTYHYNYPPNSEGFRSHALLENEHNPVDKIYPFFEKVFRDWRLTSKVHPKKDFSVSTSETTTTTTVSPSTTTELTTSKDDITKFDPHPVEEKKSTIPDLVKKNISYYEKIFGFNQTYYEKIFGVGHEISAQIHLKKEPVTIALPTLSTLPTLITISNCSNSAEPVENITETTRIVEENVSVGSPKRHSKKEVDLSSLKFNEKSITDSISATTSAQSKSRELAASIAAAGSKKIVYNFDKGRMFNMPKHLKHVKVRSGNEMKNFRGLKPGGSTRGTTKDAFDAFDAYFRA